MLPPPVSVIRPRLRLFMAVKALVVVVKLRKAPHVAVDAAPREIPVFAPPSPPKKLIGLPLVPVSVRAFVNVYTPPLIGVNIMVSPAATLKFVKTGAPGETPPIAQEPPEVFALKVTVPQVAVELPRVKER